MHATPRISKPATMFPDVAMDLGCSKIPLRPTNPKKKVKHIGIPQSRRGRPYPRGLGGAAAWAEWDWLMPEWKGPE